MTEEEHQAIADNQRKRPRFAVGDRVQVDAPASAFNGWRGRVLSVDAVQTLAGVVITYMYKLEMENLARQTWIEENLCFAPSALDAATLLDSEMERDSCDDDPQDRRPGWNRHDEPRRRRPVAQQSAGDEPEVYPRDE